MVDHVQGDPYAPASRLHLELAPTFHPHLAGPFTPLERLAAEDLFLREFAARLPSESLPAGDGPGGRIRTARPDGTVRPRSAATLAKMLHLRFAYSFPASNRRILGEPTAEVLANRLPALALEIAAAVTTDRIRELAEHLERREKVRVSLAGSGWAAFLPVGSHACRLPDGTRKPTSVALNVPENLRTEIDLGDGTTLKGLAIPRGITVLVGSAFHGKTTLLEALGEARNGLRPTDGLALACAPEETEFVSVEEDRSVAPCDLSPFFRRLPGQDPLKFAVDEASGATSQAANLLESLASGAKLVLIDEDASAANFLTRDPLISKLLPRGESVFPLADRIRELSARGVSIVVVAGASSQWLSVADRVLVLSEFQPSDATEHARKLAASPSPVIDPADWDYSLRDEILERWKELAQIPASKIRVQAGLVRFGKAAEAQFPRRFSEDDRLRGAAQLLCEFLRYCRDRALVPTRLGLLSFLDIRRDAQDPWGHGVGHDLSFPTRREVWGLWTRLKPGKGDDDAPDEE